MTVPPTSNAAKAAGAGIDLFNQTLDAIGVTIRTGDTDGRLGYYEPGTATIVISEKETGPARYITFLHEAMHAVEYAMKGAGIIKRRPPHDFIENAAMNLFLVLALGGFLNGVTPEEALKLAQEQP